MIKKAFALILAICFVVTLIGCKNNTETTSSSIEVVYEYEEIISDQSTLEQTTPMKNSSGDTLSSASQNNGDTQSTTNKHSTTSSHNMIDYNTVVEVDLCHENLRSYLTAKTVEAQYTMLSEFSGGRYDYQFLDNISWYGDGSDIYTVYISENSDFSNSYVVEMSVSEFKYGICIPGKTYYWKVVGTKSSGELAGGAFRTFNSPVRIINIDGVGNVRDIGGWKTEDGKIVKYGKMYRGRRLDDITKVGETTLKALGISTEMDIRASRDVTPQTNTLGLNYVFYDTSYAYDRIFESGYKASLQKNFKQMFSLLSDESNYPIYFHCTAGADRTGTVAFVLNGLLGVSYEDLTRDFEMTSFSVSGKRWRGTGWGGTFTQIDTIMQDDNSNYVAWGELYKDMMSDYGTGDGKLSSAIENFLVNYVGIPQMQINSFKSIMLS